MVRKTKTEVLINRIYFIFIVDLILRELNVPSDGRVFYDNLIHILTQPLTSRR
jgi:hypothetical protein